ncbi:MAG: TonB-dependent receptor [Dehalococcoidales bacterium]|nr:TonB-dependent receptor [Dehalococcoidales bacterium]
MDEENQPIENVSVFIADQNIILKTNKLGEFFFESKLPNNTYLNFYNNGYVSKLVKYKEGSEFIVFLKKLHVTLDEVGVVESYSDLGNTKLTNIDKKSLENVFLRDNSMVESITQLSGVDIVSSGLGIQKVVVRGLSGMRVVTYLNGMQINNQQWANDHGIGFTDLGLGEVELIKGASALKYGAEAIGGLLFFKDSPFVSNKKMNGYIASKFDNSSYLSSSQFGLNWNKNNFFFNLYGQYSISSDYRLPNNDYLFNSRFNQNAIKFSVAHRYKNLQNIFRYQYHHENPGIPAHAHEDPADINIEDITSSSFDFNDAYKLLTPYQLVNNQLFNYNLNYLSNNLKLSLHLGHFINNLKEYEKWTRPAFDLTISNTQITPNIRCKIKDLTFNLGSQFSVLDNKNNEDYRLVPDASTLNVGPYVIFDYEKNNFGLNSGIRYDYKHIKSEDNISNVNYDNEFSNTSFSSGIYYKFLDNILRFTYSGSYRAPHFSELFSNGVHHGTNRFEVGNENLRIEYADQFELKYHWANEHFGFVINPFLQNISDFISIVPADTLIDSYRVYNYEQYNNVEIKGVEMNLHYHPHKLHNLHIEQSYTFLPTKNKDDQYGLALVPANSIKTKILFDLN